LVGKSSNWPWLPVCKLQETTDLPEGIPGASDAVWTFPENDEMVVCVRVLGCQIYAVLLAREPSVIAQFPTFPCRIQNEFQFFVDLYSSL